MKKEVPSNSVILGIHLILIATIVSSIFSFNLVNVFEYEGIAIELIGLLIAAYMVGYLYARTYRETMPRLKRLRIICVWGIFKGIVYMLALYFNNVLWLPFWGEDILRAALGTSSIIGAIGIGGMFIYGCLSASSRIYVFALKKKNALETNESLVGYFRQNLANGLREKTLKEQALAKGYSRNAVVDSLNAAKEAFSYPQESTIGALILVFLLLAVVVVGVIVSGTVDAPQKKQYALVEKQTADAEDNVTKHVFTDFRWPHEIQFSAPGTWEQQFIDAAGRRIQLGKKGKWGESEFPVGFQLVSPASGINVVITSLDTHKLKIEDYIEDYGKGIVQLIEQRGYKVDSLERITLSHQTAYKFVMTPDPKKSEKEVLIIVIKDNFGYAFTFSASEDDPAAETEKFQNIINSITIIQKARVSR